MAVECADSGDVVSALQTLKRLLHSPSAYFDARPPARTLPVAAGLVVLFALCLLGGIYFLGEVLAGAVDATVTVDNPSRPPDQICEMHGNDPDSLFGENCDEPETIERDASEMIREAGNEFYWIALISPIVLWLLGGVSLFATGRIVGGRPSLSGSLALSGWAALPEFFRLGAGLLAVRVALADVTITEFERLPEAVETALAAAEPTLLVASLLTLAWQWHLLTGGMSREADISRRAAAVATGIPLAVVGLLAIG